MFLWCRCVIRFTAFRSSVHSKVFRQPSIVWAFPFLDSTGSSIKLNFDAFLHVVSKNRSDTVSFLILSDVSTVLIAIDFPSTADIFSLCKGFDRLSVSE